MENSSSAESKICQFYDGKTIFITGATGFMGKVLCIKWNKILKDILVGACRKASTKHQCKKDLCLDKVKEGDGNQIPLARVDVRQNLWWCEKE